jgi:hypothetical protein
MLMMGEIADALPMSDQARTRHEAHRARMFHEVVTEGVFYGQPHSEPVELGQTDTALTVGGRRFGTTARQVDGGYVLNGHKFFVCSLERHLLPPLIGDGPWLERSHGRPKDAPGVTFRVSGSFRMRGTSTGAGMMSLSRTGEILPPGLFGALNAYPHLPLFRFFRPDAGGI